jgi:hypothetical protein
LGRTRRQGLGNESGAFLIAEFGELPDYVSVLIHQMPIESHIMFNIFVSSPPSASAECGFAPPRLNHRPSLFNHQPSNT